MRSFLSLLAATAAVQAQVFDVPAHHIQSVSEELPPLPSLTRRGNDEPCAKVADLWESQRAQSASSIRVPAELAYNCLQSVPVDVKGDIQEIQELKEYLQWHSTLAYLKSGVEGQIKPLDVMGSLDAIAAKVKDGKYKSDYQVQLDIRALLDSAGDFHCYYITDLTVIFEFQRVGAWLLSISEDGLKLPQIYFETDVTSGRPASPVLTINGKNASDYLEQWSSGLNYHDADARYNNIFPNPARRGLGTDQGGAFLKHYVYDSPSTVFTFANGTSKTIDNVAFIGSSYDFKYVNDGPSFFKAFAQGPHDPPSDDEKKLKARQTASVRASSAASSTRSASAASFVRATSVVSSGVVSARPTTVSVSARSSSAAATPTSVAAPPAASPSRLVGYPEPVFIQDSRKFSGYYLNDTSYQDVAVLAIPAFDPTATSPQGTAVGGFLRTQTLLRAFFADAMKKGKKKLVIDLRGNGGGTIDMGFELFKQLFPTVEPFGGARYRAHEAFHLYTAIVADVAERGVKIDGIISADFKDADYGIQSPFLWSNILDVNGKHYKSNEDYYGPTYIHNDTFSGIRRYNFSDNTGGHTLPVSLTGYLEQPTPPQPFQAENIIIVQDGFCGSTCAIFSELMREQGKVQSIVYGGRPKNEPMQPVGGSKGSQVLQFSTLYNFAHRTLETAEALDGQWVADKINSTTAVGRIFKAEQIFQRSAHWNGQAIIGGINSLNNYRQGDDTQTPLEYVYEAADCRLFYTKETFFSPTAVWKQAVDRKWNKGKCVSGSTGHKSSVTTIFNQPSFGSKSKDGESSVQTVEVQGAASGLSASVMITLLAAVGAVGLML